MCSMEITGTQSNILCQLKLIGSLSIFLWKTFFTCMDTPVIASSRWAWHFTASKWHPPEPLTMAALDTMATHQVVKISILPLIPRNPSCFYVILRQDEGLVWVDTHLCVWLYVIRKYTWSNIRSLGSHALLGTFIHFLITITQIY